MVDMGAYEFKDVEPGKITPEKIVYEFLRRRSI